MTSREVGICQSELCCISFKMLRFLKRNGKPDAFADEHHASAFERNLKSGSGRALAFGDNIPGTR